MENICGFRGLFWEYLNKLDVGFWDICNPDESLKLPVFVDRGNLLAYYINPAGQQVLLPGGGGAIDVFTSDPTMVLPPGFNFGKYQNGDTPAWTGLTAKEAILDAIIGYINPVFTSFSVSQLPTVEVGTTLSGSKTFTWSIASNSGVINTVDLYNNTTSTTLLASTPNDGTQLQTIDTIQLNSDGSTQSWRVIGNNTSPVGIINSSNYIVTSRFYRFFGPSATSPTDSGTVRGLPSSDFHVTGDSFILTTGNTVTKFVVALPPSRTITQVLDESSLFADITSQYILTGTINVVDAGGTSRLYNIYEMNLGAPYQASKNHRIYTN